MVRRELQGCPGRSAAFKWLHDRHKELAQVIGRDRPGWATIQEHVHARRAREEWPEAEQASLIQIWGTARSATWSSRPRRSRQCADQAVAPRRRSILRRRSRRLQCEHPRSGTRRHSHRAITKESPREAQPAPRCRTAPRHPPRFRPASSRLMRLRKNASRGT